MTQQSPRIFVKICGITRGEDALAAVAAGADALGFVFWPGSPRAVTAAAAAHIARELPPFVARVGVFVDASLRELRDTADRAGLDVLQLHGSLSPEDCAGMPRRVIKALSVGAQFRAEDATAYGSHAAGVLLDTYSRSSPGGT
ncbi:MAG TPA: phosphoribosylanthranilate isomerase, partial [Vicinamibacteria bacterium]